MAAEEAIVDYNLLQRRKRTCFSPCAIPEVDQVRREAERVFKIDKSGRVLAARLNVGFVPEFTFSATPFSGNNDQVSH